MIKIGKFAKMTSLDQKDMVKITESRILYRRKPDGSQAGRDGFSPLANLSPEFYIDPNDEVRKGIKEALMLVQKQKDAAAKPDDKTKQVADAKPKDPKADPAVQKAGN